MQPSLRKALAALLVLISGLCLWKALPGGALQPVSDGLVASAQASPSELTGRASAPRLETRPIQDIRVGCRVLARNPEISDLERAAWGAEPNWRTWIFLKLRMAKPGQGVLHIEMIRPPEWLEEQVGSVVSGLADRDWPTATADLVGRTIQLDLPEMGAAGSAVIEEIGACPEIEVGDGHVVTATFHHEASAPVLDVAFADEEQWQPVAGFHHVNERDTADHDGVGSGVSISRHADEHSSLEHIGVTDNHLFWSVDRQQFVAVGALAIGEQVQTYHGHTKRLASKLPRPGPQEVYNLEVYGEHVYFVGASGVLAHNAYARLPASAQDLGLPVLNRDFVPDTRRVLGILTDRAVRDLAANPRLAHDLMSLGSYAHLRNNTRLAAATYGKAVERLVARYVQEDELLSNILRHTGLSRGSNGQFIPSPDFVGTEAYNLRLFELTTADAIPRHLSRPGYGGVAEFIIHPGKGPIQFP